VSKATVLFRCDAGPVHGLGHLSRCLVIGDAVALRGGSTRFLVHNALDFEQRFARHAWKAAPTETAGLGDLDFVRSEIPVASNTILVVDSKRADVNYVRAARQMIQVAQIGDWDFEMDADLTIDNNVGAEQKGRGAGYCLIGPLYNSIRPGFFTAAQRNDRRAILVTFGGDDPHNHTAWVLRNMSDLLAGRSVIIIVGPSHPDPDAVVAAASLLPQHEIHRAPGDLIPFAERAEFAISAGGTTCYELAASGIAIAAIAVEDHQERLIAALADRNALIRIGGANVTVDEARATVRRLLADAVLKSELTRAGRALFPAPGAPRIAQALLELASRPQS